MGRWTVRARRRTFSYQEDGRQSQDRLSLLYPAEEELCSPAKADTHLVETRHCAGQREEVHSSLRI